MVLMALTVAASYIHLGQIGNNVVAMAIAVCKAVLVILFFMGVKYATNLTKMWAVLGFCWMPLIFGIFMDYDTRSHETVPGFYYDAGSTMKDGLSYDLKMTPGAAPYETKTPATEAPSGD